MISRSTWLARAAAGTDERWGSCVPSLLAGEGPLLPERLVCLLPELHRQGSCVRRDRPAAQGGRGSRAAPPLACQRRRQAWAALLLNQRRVASDLALQKRNR